MQMSIQQFCLIGLLVLTLATLAPAGNTLWQNPGSGNWSDSSNWDNGEPSSSDNAWINNGGTAQITSPNDECCDYLYLGNNSGDSGTVELTGGSLSATHSIYVGRLGSGTLEIRNGGAVSSYSGTIGYYPYSTGTVLVDGAGSTWTNDGYLYVGRYGAGTLKITSGGAVTVGRDTYVASTSSSSGVILFNSGTLTTDGLLCGASDLTGTGTINTHGLVSDVDLVFDATHGLNQTFNINSNSGQNITLNLDVDGSSPLGVGYSGTGTMNISDGVGVSSTLGYIGYKSGSNGTVTVDGAGSTWTVSNTLYVGYKGSGALEIRNGGTINVQRNTRRTTYESSSGTINFDNGTLTTGGLLYAADDLTGTGTINTHGIVSDVDLVFDATHGLNQTFNIADNPGQNITLNLTVDGSAPMGVGFSGTGTMIISDGIEVSSTEGYIGYGPGSTGTVTVDGAGSAWTSSSWLYVGDSGNGTLNITNGGAVSSSSNSVIGFFSDSTGMVLVDGAGSTWTNNIYLNVGSFGSGTLNIANGGAASSSGNSTIGYYSSSTGTVSVDGAGSTWANSGDLTVGRYGSGTLKITNSGLVSVAGTLTIDEDSDGDGFINMSTGGMLALYGDADANGDGDITLAEFYDMIDGTDAINYWDGSQWTPLTGATEGVDYWLSYYETGDLAGYTMLTVGVPEPAIMLLLIGGLSFFRRRR